MATGDSKDILSRVRKLLPLRWFAWGAPLRDAILGGLSDVAANLYNFIGFAKLQSRIDTATGPFLDLISFEFLGRHLPRKGLSDTTFRAKIKATILQERVTRNGMVGAITTITGNAPAIIEPWNTGDCGSIGMALAIAGASPAYGPSGGLDIAAGIDLALEIDVPLAVAATTSGGAGCLGDTDLPAQVFMVVKMPGLAGIPSAPGIGSSFAGLDVSYFEIVDESMVVGAVTPQDVYDTINTTRPTGTICWTQLH